MEVKKILMSLQNSWEEKLLIEKEKLLIAVISERGVVQAV